MTTAEQISIACSIGGLVVSVVIMIVVLMNKSQKREVSFGFVPASKQEFDAHVANNTKRHGELFHGIDIAKKECAESVESSCTRLEAKVDENYADLSEKIRSLPNELVMLLRNTGVIK